MLEDNKKEFNEFDEDIESIDEGDLNVFTVEVEKTFNDLKTSITRITNDLKTKFSAIDLSKEAIEKYCDEFSNSLDEIVKGAGETIEEIKNHPKTNETVQTVKDTYNKVTSTIADKANEIYAKARENEGFKKTSDKVVGKTTEIRDNIADKYQQFIHDPSVRKTVVGAVNAVKDTFNNVYNEVKKALNEEESQESKEE